MVGYSPFHGLPQRGELLAVALELRATPRQVALAFLTRLPDTFAIPKASKVEHVRENAGAGTLTLTEKQIARLDRAYPIRIRRELPVI
jgi:diketogulonate reductase-like aldo/keto reductase